MARQKLASEWDKKKKDRSSALAEHGFFFVKHH
jgi:hypothetical protein